MARITTIDSGASPGSPVGLRLPVLVWALLFTFYLLTVSGAISPRVSDGRAMYLVTRALVDRRDFAVVTGRSSISPEVVGVAPGWRPLAIPPGACATEPPVIAIGANPAGPFYSKFGLGQSLAAAPLYMLGLQIARAGPSANHDEIAAFVTSLYCALVTAGTAAIVCALALRLGWSRGTAVALSLLFGVATPTWVYTTSFFSEPTVGLALLGALSAALWRDSGPTARHAGLCGAWLALAVLTHVADCVLYIPAFGLFLLLRSRCSERRRCAAAFLIPLLAAGLIVAWYNEARFSSIFITGYGIIGDVHDLHPPHTLRSLWEGIYGPVLSPGKGILFYAPILALFPAGMWRFWQRDRGATLLIAATITVCVLSHANTLVIWLGGWAWGPRFLLPIIPLALLPLGTLLEAATRGTRAVAATLGALGAIIQVPAVLLDKGEYISYLQNKQPGHCIWTAEDLYKWHPAYSPLLGQWGRLLDAATYSIHGALAATASNIAAGRIVPKPHPWWSLLARQGVQWPVLIAVVAALLMLTVILLLATVHAVHSDKLRHDATFQYRIR